MHGRTGKASTGPGIPLHGRALRVSREFRFPRALWPRVLAFFRGHGYIQHPDFVSIIEGRRPAQREQQHRGRARRSGAIATGDAVLIVVTKHVVGPRARRKCRFQLVYFSAHQGGTPGNAHQREIAGHVDFIQVSPVITGPFAPVEDVNLTDREARASAAIFVQQSAQLAIDGMYIGVTAVVDVQLRIVCVHRFVTDRRVVAIGRVISQHRVFHEAVRGIHPESVHPALQPETHNGEHGLFHCRVSPVQVGLFLQIGVQIILAGVRVPFPGRPAKDTQPVIWRASVRTSIAPGVPIAFRVAARGA